MSCERSESSALVGIGCWGGGEGGAPRLGAMVGCGARRHKSGGEEGERKASGGAVGDMPMSGNKVGDMQAARGDMGYVCTANEGEEGSDMEAAETVSFGEAERRGADSESSVAMNSNASTFAATLVAVKDENFFSFLSLSVVPYLRLSSSNFEVTREVGLVVVMS